MAEVAAAYADGFPVDVVLDGCSSVVDVWCKSIFLDVFMSNGCPKDTIRYLVSVPLRP